MSNDQDSPTPVALVIALFGLIALLIAMDMWIDRQQGAGWRHLGIETLVLLGAVSGMSLLWRQLQQSRKTLAGTLRDASRWRDENRALMAGLGAAIGRQFERWQLSAAESDVALLLLKGLSHREIAQLRQTSERTVREQARAVYRKSGLGGRSALSAFFLEDLLPPVPPSSRQA